MRKTKWIVPVLWGIFLFIIQSLRVENFTLSRMILSISFGMGEAYFSNINLFLMCYMNIAIVHVLYGVEIYKCFCEASIYYFARMGDRKKWFLNELLKLVIQIVGYVVLNLLTILILNLCFGKIQSVTWVDVVVTLYYIISFSLFMIATTLIINYLSVFLSSSAAFGIVEFINAACICIYFSFVQFTDTAGMDFYYGKEYLLYANPICQLIVGIHSSKIDLINERIDVWGWNFDILVSLIYLAVLCAFTVALWMLTIGKLDIMGSGAEGTE